MSHEEGQPEGALGREVVVEAAAWSVVVLFIFAILVLGNLPCGGMTRSGPPQISCQLLETLLKWTLRLFVLLLPLAIGFSLRRRTRSIQPDERDKGDRFWLP